MRLRERRNYLDGIIAAREVRNVFSAIVERACHQSKDVQLRGGRQRQTEYPSHSGAGS